jgi:enoyl-CoA hydratase/carnithine racemase
MIAAKNQEREMSDDVCYDVSDGIATLTLNRPERMNTISGPCSTI